jgi:hypothetical protein
MVQLNRFLLRTVCSDLFILLLRYVAEDNGVNFPSDTAPNVQVCFQLLFIAQAGGSKQNLYYYHD